MELLLEVVAVAQGPGAIDGVDGEDVPWGAPAPEVAAPAAVAVPDVVVVGRVDGRGDGGAPAPNPVREASELLLPEAGLREEEGKMRRRSREEEGKRTLYCARRLENGVYGSRTLSLCAM